MSIKIICACGKNFSVKDELAGRTLKCPECQKPLRIPKPKVEEEPTADEWDLGDSAEEDFDGEPSSAPTKSRGGKSSATRGSASRKSSVKGKGKKSKTSNRGLLIGLSAGGSVLVVALLSWLLWPAAPEANVADNPPANPGQNPAAASGDAAQASPVGETTPAMPSPSGTPPANVVDDDLKALQGDWHFVDMQTDPPASAQSLAAIKLITVTFADDSMTIDPGNSGPPKTTTTVKLDASKNPKTIDVTPTDGPQKDKPGFGIYSLEGQVLKLYVNHKSRPTSWTPVAGAEGIMVLNRGRSATVANAQPLEDKFDHEAWKRVQSTLRPLGIQSQLLTRREAPESIPEGVQAVAVLVLPDLSASDRYPDNIASTIKSLSHVIVKTLEMNDTKLKQLSEHSGLIGLNLSGKSVITTDGLRTLKPCPLFRHLYLEKVSLAPADLMPVISEFKDLSSLSLNDMPVTDNLLLHLQPLTRLDTLSLQNTSITDAGTAHLAKLISVKTLFLEGTKLTDEGLRSLKSLNNLRMFSARRTSVTPQGLDEFQTALPGCQILK